LFRVVLDAVRSAHRAVVPVLPLADTVKTVDDAGLLRTTPDRSGLRVVQTPHAFRGPDLHFGPPGAGTSTVPGDPLAFAVRTPWDLELAELLLEFGP
jgi:2-C-methyl-D-erythritol 4-phosphate cytidylyltransferase